jgi:hypothetical protein
MLKIPRTNNWVSLNILHMSLSTTCSILRDTKLSTIEFPSDKRSQVYSWNTPHFFLLFFEKDTASDLWEVATCLVKLLWMMVWFHCYHPFCTLSLKLCVLTVGRGWWWCIKVSFILISSHSIWDKPVTFLSPPFDLTQWSCHIFFGCLRD